MKLKFFCTAALAVAPGFCLAQQASLTPPPANFVRSAPDAPVSSTASPAAVVASGQQTSPVLSPWESKVDRWFDLEALTFAGRYRNSTNTEGRHLFQFGQDRYIADGRIKLDSQGRYSVNFHASSGRYFNWAYADEVGGDYAEAVVAARPYRYNAYLAAVNAALAVDPDAALYKAGFPTRGGYFYLRQLYFSATPIKAVTVEFGSLAIDHGQNSEITSFDDDGYLSGERVGVKDPKHLYFDRVGATWAYIGHSLTPNFLARGSDLTHSNYQQYLVEKSFGSHVKASTDFTEIRGTHTFREAASVNIPQAKVIDNFLAELYQRTNSTTVGGILYTPESGFGVSASKTMFRRLEFTGGYDSVDRWYGVYSGSPYLTVTGYAWNGDSYLTGRHGFAKTNLKLANGISAFGYYTHLIAPPNPTTVAGHFSQRQGYNAGMSFDLKALAESGRKLFQ